MANNNHRTKFSILFIDDEEQARKYFKRAYSNDFNILTAESVEDAKIVLNEHSDEIGVLITDQRMPGANGVVLLNYVKEKYPHIVRLLTTAYSDLTDAIAAVNSGEILRYIVKPWDLQTLRMELEHALRFFQIQSERDQLINEKLNVWQRMTELNRVRDLLVMAGSFSHLNNPLQGIRSLLLQTQVSADHISDEQSLDLWQLLEQEVNHTLSLTKSVLSATLATDARFVETSPGDLLLKLEADDRITAKIQTVSARDWPSVEGCPELLLKLFESLASWLIAITGDPELRISVDGIWDEKSLALNIKATTEVEVDTRTFSASQELMVAFLITAHHGGELILNRENPVSIDFKLPRGTENIFSAVDEDYWLEEIFSVYERQYQ